MKVLIDMNLPPSWVQALEDRGFQVRTQNLSPDHLIDLVVRGLRQHEAALERGALISIDEQRLRARVLPLLD